jgi:Tol biopolymer transport system component
MPASCTDAPVVGARRPLFVLSVTVVVAVAGVATSGTASPSASRRLVPRQRVSVGYPVRSSPARQNGRIVYADPGVGRGWSLFTVNAEGRDKKLLTRDGGSRPRWSPDGTKLLFTRGDNLVVMRAGRHPVRRLLIKGPINGAAGVTAGIPELAAHWSPDGRRIVFATVRGIEVANVDRSGRRVLLRTRPQQLYFGDPEWSPDGGQIVLQGNQFAPLTWPSVPEQIYLMRADGTGLRQLTYGFIHFHENPSWSPDGRWILFARCPVPWATGQEVSELVLLKPDGSGQRTIARLPGTDCVRMITWSPDGRRILYLNERTGVEIMNVDGSARRRLLPWVLGVNGFSWQPLP